MKTLQRAVALIQMVAGVLALVLVAVAYGRYAPGLRNVLHSLDRIAEKAEQEADVAIQIMKRVQSAGRKVEQGFESHGHLIDAAVVAAKDMATLAKKWDTELQTYSDLSRDAASICSRLEGELPIRLPAADVKMKEVSFDIVEVIPRTEPVRLPYFTAKVAYDTVSLSYPQASVQMSSVTVAGRRLEYPSGIEIKERDQRIKYPTDIKLIKDFIDLRVPSRIDFKKDTQKINVPDKITIHYRELMQKEKELLVKASGQLVATSESLQRSRKGLQGVSDLLDGKLTSSLNSIKECLTVADKELLALVEGDMPAAIKAVIEQKTQLTSSRSVFTVIEGLIPLLGIVLALIPAGMISGGAWKYYATAPSTLGGEEASNRIVR